MVEVSTSSVCELMCPADAGRCSKDLVLLDVRSPIEFETEHVPASINVPLEQLERRLEEVPREGQLVVICRTGKRAERGALILLGKGFQPKVLEGGLVGWRKAGLPVAEGKKMLSIERQIQLIVGIGVLTGVLLAAVVNPWFLIVPGFFGAGLTFAGLSGTCALGLLLTKAPWNRLPNISGCNNTTSEKTEPKTGCCG